VPELDTSVFIIPGERVKNGDERLVVLNGIAKSVVESVRGLHPVNVFVRAHKKVGESRLVTKMNNTSWKAARERAAGVSFEDRQDLLGHRSGRITTHYSQAELASLIEAAEKVCDTESRKSPATTWLRRKTEAVETLTH
jgi:integrase